MLSFTITLVICLCYVSLLTANPIHRIGELDFVPGKGSQSLQESRSQITTPNPNGKLCSSSDRLCKLHRRTQDFYIWKALPLEFLLRIHNTTPVLLKTYHAIVAHVNEQWSLRLPISSSWIKQDTLDLFYDAARGPIPWSVVATFAHKILSATQLGWFSAHDVIYPNRTADRAIGATLQIANDQPSLPPQHPLATKRTLEPAKRSHLEKRARISLTAYKLHGAIVPAAAAAPFVKAFFDAIAAEASNTWTFLPESALFTVREGPFQLTLSCLGSPIPWPLVVAFAQRFSILADHQFVNTFDAFYEEPGSAITVAISLRLLNRAGGLMATSFPLPIPLSQPAKRDLLQQQERNPPPDSTTTTTTTTTPPSSLTPRTFPGPSIGMTHFVRLGTLLPVETAAQRFQDFYTIIAVKIETGQLADRLPSKRMVCSLWDFELVFSCDSMDVPLSFVQAFAIDMAEWSSRYVFFLASFLFLSFPSTTLPKSYLSLPVRPDVLYFSCVGERNSLRFVFGDGEQSRGFPLSPFVPLTSPIFSHPSFPLPFLSLLPFFLPSFPPSPLPTPPSPFKRPKTPTETQTKQTGVSQASTKRPSKATGPWPAWSSSCRCG